MRPRKTRCARRWQPSIATRWSWGNRRSSGSRKTDTVVPYRYRPVSTRRARHDKWGVRGKHMNKERRDNVPSITVHADLALERVLTLELVRVTERAAVSAAR